jgi:hypothetical protein
MTPYVRRLVPIAAIVQLCSGSSPSAQAPSLDEVLTRAAAYLREYVPRLARVVSSEDYEQRITVSSSGPPIAGPGGSVSSSDLHTTQLWRLKSEVLLVRYPSGDVDWMWFRDVIEADGKPLQHDADRLMKLFMTPGADVAQQAARISYEGFRYNLAGATVPATNPILVVALMQANYQPRLRFKLGDAERSLGANVRAVKFEEREEAESTPGQRTRQKLPPLLGPAGRIRGTVWIDTQTGEILKTEARIGELNTLTTTATTYAREPRLALLVPAEMRTNWKYIRRDAVPAVLALPNMGGVPVTGVAKYSNFRRFEATTETPVLQVPQ